MIAAMALEDALDLIPPGARIVAAQGCGAPTMLLNGLPGLAERRPGLHLLTGLQIDDQPYLQTVADGRMRYTTWHVTRPSRPLVADGRADHLPVRLSEVPAVLRRNGVDVAMVRVSPPDASGLVSLGPSMCYSPTAIDEADVVLGEIDPQLPRTNGPTTVPVERFSALVESDRPTPAYRSIEPDDVAQRIATHLLEYVPDSATFQLGVGQVPEAVADTLLSQRVGELRFVGLGVERLADLADAGLLASPAGPLPPITSVELLGNERLMRFADQNPLLGVYPSTEGHDPAWLATHFDRIVSINSAVEIDLFGQVNSEMVAGTQLSTVGGSMDFIEAARLSDGGLSIIAFPATTRDGSVSRIIPRLGSDVVTTIPRHCVSVVVTEHGSADLRGRTVRERASALIEIADPAHREGLERAIADQG